MTRFSEKMKYLYIKNGDAATQVTLFKKYIGGGISTEISGPNSFLFYFLSANATDNIVVVSRSQKAHWERFHKTIGITFRDGEASVEKFVYRLINILQLLSMTLCERYDRVICGVSGTRLWLLWVLCRVLGIPLVASRHNCLYTPKMNRLSLLKAKIDAWILSKVRTVVCHGPYLKEEMLRHKISDAIEFEVPLADLYESTMGMEKAKSNCLRIYYVGRIEREKGLLELIEAVRCMEICGGVTLTIIGSGSMAPLVEKWAAEEISQLVYLGPLGRDALATELKQNCDLIVCPSKPYFPEGRCMVVLESLVLNIPVVAPNYGPFPHAVINNFTGILFDYHSAKAIKEAVLTINKSQNYEKICNHINEIKHQYIVPNKTFDVAIAEAFSEYG